MGLLKKKTLSSLCILVVMLIPWCVCAAEKTQEASARVMACDKEKLSKQLPTLDMALMFRFYEEYSRDLLDEWKQKCVSQPQQSMDYLRRLAVHFQKLEDVRKTDPVEYKRLIVYESQQCRIRALSRDIRKIAARASSPSQETAADASLQSALAQAKEELHGLLERSFDESLRQQEYEVDKLEQEIVELRQIISMRRRNRQATLEQRFRALCGE